MILKNIIFTVIALSFISCGVMNNPDKSSADDAVLKDGSPENSNQLIMISKIDVPTYDFNIDSQPSSFTTYRVFETKASTDQFFTNLNNSKKWQKSIDDANISYQRSSLLFYPIYREQNCGLKDKIKLNDKNVTITLEGTKECNNTSIYHLLWYEISKDLENITIQAFDKKPVSFQNRAN
jgi:hypothetical protein